MYLAAEGFLYWENPQRWLMWATGKTILGALIGGYVAVECAKKAVGYRAPTGDLFAMAASIGIILGRVGCLLHGCCPGAVCDARWWTLADANEVARWPTVPIEIAFNVLAFEGCLILRRRALLPGQHFHLYLIGYGLFRFVHEFVRDTPRVLGGFSGYHFAAVAVAVLGTTGFMLRQAATNNQAVR